MELNRSLVAIVDDEEPVGRAIERLLRSTGYTAQSFSSGKAFLDWLATHRPDCVVLDLHMPGMSGLDIQHQIQQSAIQLPIVAITGHDTPEIMQRVLAGGAKAYLRKPVDSKALLDAITAAIATH